MAQPPAGLEKNLVKLFSKGDDNWRDLLRLKLFTNAFVRNRKTGKVLTIMH